MLWRRGQSRDGGSGTFGRLGSREDQSDPGNRSGYGDYRLSAVRPDDLDHSTKERDSHQRHGHHGICPESNEVIGVKGSSKNLGIILEPSNPRPLLKIMDKHLLFYVMFFPTVIFFLWGISLHISIWLEGGLEGAENATKREKLKIYIGRGWGEFWARPGWYVKIFITEVIFHRKLFGQSFYRWLAHTLLVFGFVATFAVDMIKGL